MISSVYTGAIFLLQISIIFYVRLILKALEYVPIVLEAERRAALSNKEEEYLLKEAAKDEVPDPIFGPPDRKIMATGELFRGPSTGIISEFDIENPGRKFSVEEEKFD